MGYFFAVLTSLLIFCHYYGKIKKLKKSVEILKNEFMGGPDIWDVSKRFSDFEIEMAKRLGKIDGEIIKLKTIIALSTGATVIAAITNVASIYFKAK